MLIDDFIVTLPSTAGVYQFYVYPLGKYYIGESVNIRRRVLEHLNGNGKKELFEAIKIYGLDSVGFQILEFESDRQKRIALEQKYKLLYGLDRLLNSISTKENGSCGKAVLAFSKEGKFVRRFGSISEASAFVCRSSTTVSDACLGKALFVGGYAWMFEANYTEAKLAQKLAQRKLRDIKKKNHLSKLSSENKAINSKPVRATNNAEELIFNSITEAALFAEVSVSYLSNRVYSNKIFKNYEWSFINV